MAYVTSAVVKSYLGITSTEHDTVIGYLITSMENLFNTLIGVDSLDNADYTGELTLGFDQRYFYLKNFPVTTVTKITDYASDIEYTGWSVDKIVGRKVYLDKSHGLDAGIEYEIDYNAGYTDGNLPEEVKTCVSFMIGGALSDQAKNPGVQSYSILGKSMTFRSDAEYSFARDLINQYAAGYKKVKVRGI